MATVLCVVSVPVTTVNVNAKKVQPKNGEDIHHKRKKENIQDHQEVEGQKEIFCAGSFLYKDKSKRKDEKDLF